MLPATYDKPLRVFRETATFLREHRHALTNTLGAKREGTSSFMPADLEAERRLAPVVCEIWHCVALLCEEAGTSRLTEVMPGVDILPWGDDVTDLPPICGSLDGLDGSALFANGELDLVAMSAGLIANGKPVAGIVMRLSDFQLFVADRRPGINIGPLRDGSPLVPEPKRPLKQSLIGLDDCKAVDDDFRRGVIAKLTGNPGTRYPINVPSCAGGLKVLEGKLAAYVTSNARHWDIAGTAALCEAAGMVVRCLSGSPVPWNQVRMPPVVFARDEEAFAYVQETAREYLVLQEENVSP